VDLVEVIRITALMAVLFNVALTLLVLTKDFRSRLHRVYVLWGISVTLWNLGVYHLSQSTEEMGHDDAMFWARILQLGVIFIPLTIFHLSAIISGTRTRGLLPVFYLIDLGFVASLYLGWFIVDVRPTRAGYWSVAGPAFPWYGVFYLLLTSMAAVMLYRKQKSSVPTQRTRLRALLLAMVGLWVFGSNDMIPIFSNPNNPDVHYPYPLDSIRFCPMGSLAAVFYVVIIGYSVLQHRLLDIHVTMSRFAAQFVRLCFMFLTGFAMLLLIQHFAPETAFNPTSFAAAIGVLLASALVASFFFPQFFGKGTDRLERKILGDRFEYHARVQSVIETIRSLPEPQLALQELNDLLAITVRVRSYQIILLDEATRGFVLFHSYPPRREMTLSDWQIESPVFRYFQQTRVKYLSCNPVYETENESMLQRDARQQLGVFEAEFCFPFLSGSELVGFLLLGAKTSGDLFTPHDLRLLTELSNSLGLLLNQIRLRHQLQVVHEQDLLGRMSRGLAHDLNNLLTPVQTLLQLLRESSLNQATIDELLPVGLRNLETVRTYVNEALFFSRASHLKGTPGSLNATVRDAVALVQPAAAAKGIEIRFDSSAEVVMEMDAVLIKRLICNLLSNAVDASHPGGRIEIQLAPLPKTELRRDWHRLKIVDHGEGISAENLQRVFTPYFTTKNTGDGRRGFGLGLAIARKIVHLHGGTLSIASRENKGATVQVDLPSKLHPAQNGLGAAVETNGEAIPA
jgi:signal transduction histidine kinase